MNTLPITNDRSHLDGCQYALGKDRGEWRLTFHGQPAAFKHELGALYVAYLLLNRSREPLHAVALALRAREWDGQATPEDAVEEGSMGFKELTTHYPHPRSPVSRSHHSPAPRP